jgi:putative ABC transport system permease protein
MTLTSLLVLRRRFGSSLGEEAPLGSVRRGTKNAFRNSIRTVAIVSILGVSLSLALVMLVSYQAAKQRISSVSASVGTTVTIRPSGFGGFGGGGNPLTAANVATISSTPHVAAVAASVTDRLSNTASGSSGFDRRGTGGTTSLASPIKPGSLGRRFGGGAGFTPPANFTLPVAVTGTTDPLNPLVYGVTTVTLVKGSDINGRSSALTALVGTSLATKNKLNVGSTFTAYGKAITVSGIFNAHDTAANAAFTLPLKTAQTLSGITGVTQVFVAVDSVGDVATTTTALQSRLGSSVADVTSGSSNTAATASSLNSIKTIALYSFVGALIAAAAILLLSMMMIVRERRREIGILKAFGSSNGGVVGTFVSEALTLTGMAAVFGVLLGLALANPILGALVSSQNNSGGGRRFGGFPPAGGPPSGFRFGTVGFGGHTLGHLHAVLGTNVAIYAVLAAAGIALVGSAVPAYLIAKVRPAEVMRSE